MFALTIRVWHTRVHRWVLSPCERLPSEAQPVDAPERRDVLSRYRQAGEASARAGGADASHEPGSDPTAAAFFDVDNTMMRGASMFHFAVGLARRKYFSGSELLGFGVKQLKFVLSGSEDLEDVASATEAALSCEGRRVESWCARRGGTRRDHDRQADSGTLAIAQGHLDAGQQVWLVTATPIELASLIAKRLGLTGALGTVSQVKDGVYTGHLDGPPLHGLAKAEAIKALAVREGLDLSRCSAYSDSSNDIPMLSAVGTPVAVNPDPALRAHARENDWKIRDFRRREQFKRVALPAAAGAGGVAVGLVVGYAAGRVRRTA